MATTTTATAMATVSTDDLRTALDLLDAFRGVKIPGGVETFCHTRCEQCRAIDRAHGPRAGAQACHAARCHLRRARFFVAERYFVSGAERLFSTPRPDRGEVEWFNARIAMAACVTPALIPQEDGRPQLGNQAGTLLGRVHGALFVEAYMLSGGVFLPAGKTGADAEREVLAAHTLRRKYYEPAYIRQREREGASTADLMRETGLARGTLARRRGGH